MKGDDELTVTLRLSTRDAERFTHALSDILCWCRGFRAGIGENLSIEPIGDNTLRDLNIKLKDAITESEGTK